MQPGSAIDLVVFDCDGVLIDSEVIAARAHAKALSRLGYPIGVEEIIRRFAGVPDRDMVAILEREMGHALPDDYAAQTKDAIRRSYGQDLEAIPHVREAVAAIGVPICVASSSLPDKLQLGLRLAGLHHLFAPHVFSAAQVRRGKPWPDLFLFVAERMGAVPARCVVVEDSLVGVKAAVAAGMTALGFTGGSHCETGHAALLRSEGAALVFDDMRQLPAILMQQPGSMPIGS
jgi:HAD superfamily hydrolase (TIGR01509 family)